MHHILSQADQTIQSQEDRVQLLHASKLDVWKAASSQVRESSRREREKAVLRTIGSSLDQWPVLRRRLLHLAWLAVVLGRLGGGVAIRGVDLVNLAVAVVATGALTVVVACALAVVIAVAAMRRASPRRSRVPGPGSPRFRCQAWTYNIVTNRATVTAGTRELGRGTDQ